MEKNWFGISEKKKETGKSLLPYLGLIVATATVLVFSTLFFTDLSFSASGTVSLSLNFFLLFTAAYIMYASLFETGKSEGEKEACFRTLFDKRNALFAEFHRIGTQKTLAEFCKAQSEKETREARERILDEHFMSEEDVLIAKGKDPKERTRRERRALLALEKQRAVIITPRAVLAERPTALYHAPLSLSPEKARIRRTLTFLLPLALFTAVSVSLAFEVVRDPTADTLIAYLLKLFALLHSAIKGFRAGFYHTTQDRCDYMHEQCDILIQYFGTHGTPSDIKAS